MGKALRPFSHMLYSVIVINWFSIISSSFWIAGLSLLLAAFSYHHWLINQKNRRLIDQLNQPSLQRFFWISLVFFSVGIAATSQKIWEIIVWIIIAIVSAVNTVRA